MFSEDGPFTSRHTLRLQSYDYSTPGAYFITICLQHRCCLFGNVEAEEMRLNDAGLMVRDIWLQVPQFYPQCDVNEYVVMPNHFHAVLWLRETEEDIDERAHEQKDGRPRGAAPTMRLFDVIERFKSLTTTKYISGVKMHGWAPFDGKLWQRGYYEHVVRNEQELSEIRKYILNNPLQWALDKDNPDHA